MAKTSILLITPPFTQLNTPYPATAYLKGFFNSRNISAEQSDLGIDVTLALFQQEVLSRVFLQAGDHMISASENAKRIFSFKEEYLDTIEAVISFLQGKNPTLAFRIASRGYLPEADRFQQLSDLHWAFGTMGVLDQAKHLATLYLEDLADFIKELIDPHFGFSRYAEKLARSAGSFDALYEALNGPLQFIDTILLDLLEKRIQEVDPEILAISIPFPGNLYAGLRCGQWIKNNHPSIKVALGGGFANTELRSVSDTRVFEFIDFITLDDGEAPLENLIGFVKGENSVSDLKRTLFLKEGEVVSVNAPHVRDYKQAETGTPDYSGLPLDKYISAIEVVNPMHRLWSDGRWNKLTMAHGCYWGKCTFCDISLDYIKIYEPLAAGLLCDRMEEMIRQTGNNGFHFVDEAAPPALMKELALEILRRRLNVSWWTNIRFEKSFTRDLCLLLKASGCIAVSGGLEVASDRLLKLIQKGITVEQVARVNRNFTEAGIMVHAYLMYGFPTQTAQETIDSLEMVRQMFQCSVLQSAYWHLFTMTAHSPVGLEPEKFKVKRLQESPAPFANNDLLHEDPTGADHELYGEGLRKALFNYMHGVCLEDPLHKWFDVKVPKTTVLPDHIRTIVSSDELASFNPTARIVFIGNVGEIESFTQTKKGNSREVVSINFRTLKTGMKITLPLDRGQWFIEWLQRLSIKQKTMHTLADLRTSYESNGWDDFELFWDNKPISGLYKAGLLRL